MQHWEIIIFFFIIAVVNGSVGFGGGTSYMAILTLYALPHQEMKLTALLCNIIVVTGGVIIFLKNGFMNWKRILPFVLFSVPLAFAGARYKIGQEAFHIVLGLCLVTAAILMWIKTMQVKEEEVSHHKNEIAKGAVIGGGIGFLSGMVGIGGGVFLSPVLNLMKWDTQKKMAATASFFILVNSLSGIAGQLTLLPSDLNITRILLLSATVLIGGQIGSHMGALKLNQLMIRRITSFVVLIAGVSVLMRHIPLLK